MAYTLGVLEQALQNIKDRLDLFTGSGKKLDGVNIFVGSRSVSAGTQHLPAIYINFRGYSEETKNQASYQGQKNGTMIVEFRLLDNKLTSSASGGGSATNVLFDGNGNGILSLFQNFLDTLEFSAFPASSSNYNPTLSLQLEKIPDARFDLEEDEARLEMIVTAEFEVRFTLGARGGVTT